MAKLWAYTRQFHSETGAAMHLALQENGVMTDLNHAFGVLFPKADLSSGIDGQSKGIINPWIFRTQCGGYGVAALRRNVNDRGIASVEEAASNCVIMFFSRDLLSWKELGLVPAAEKGEVIEDVRCGCHEGGYCLQVLVNGEWKSLYSDSLKDFALGKERPVTDRPSADIWDADGISSVEIDEAAADLLKTRLIPPMLPKDAPDFIYPIGAPRGDPMAFRYKGGYLYMATDDERDQKALKIRYADTLAGIPFEKDHIIFTANDEGDYSGCLWAPELHRVGDRLCIFFAAGMPHWYTVQSRVMWLTGDDPLEASSWSEPKRMEKADGSHLTDDGITLDMSVVPSGDRSFVIWSQRAMYNTEGTKIECGTADLMIAELNTEEPWRLKSEPVCLCRPEYGWERIGTPVTEGPFLLKHDDTLFVTYAAALIDHTYAVGLMWAKDGADLTDMKVWSKCGYPVLHRLSMPHQLGAGHNSFVKDEQGRDILLIHALDMRNYLHSPKDGRRYPCMRMIARDKTGFPHLDAR